MSAAYSCSSCWLVLALVNSGCGQGEFAPDAGVGLDGGGVRSHDAICANATAAPDQLVALKQVGSVAALGTTVFFAAAKDATASIFRVPRTGGAAEVVDASGAGLDETRTMASDGTNVYYPVAQQLMRVSEQGQPEKMWSVSGHDLPSGVTVDSASVYLSVDNTYGEPAGVVTSPRGGGDPTRFESPSPTSPPFRIGSDGDRLYLQIVAGTAKGGSSLQRIPRGGGSAAVLAQRVGIGLVADEAGAYVVQIDATAQHEMILHFAPGSDVAETLWTFDRTVDFVVGLALSKDAVYALHATMADMTLEVERMPRDGGCVGRVARGGTLSSIRDFQPLSVDDLFVYWATADGVMKAAR